MITIDQMWGGDWRARIRGRVHSMGCETVGDFLKQHPAEPYFKVARRLGDDVAAVQLSQMQFEEVTDINAFRRAAMDGFAREITANLKRGWGVGRHVVFNTAGARTGWIILLEYRAGAPHLVSKGEAVWNELESINPPEGWLPSGPNDPIIQAAFAKAWP